MITSKIITIILILLLSLQLTQAMGYGVTQRPFVVAEPGLSKTFTFTIIPTSSETLNYTISLEGELSKYLTVEPEKIFLNVKPNEQPLLKATLNIPNPMPADFSPGLHKAYVNVEEGISGKGAGMFVVNTAAAIKIEILSLYDGKFLTDPKVIIPNVNENEDITTKVTISNFGKEKINSANAKIEVFDKNKELVKSFNTNTGSIDSRETIDLTGVAKNNLTSGNYDVTITVFWDGKTTTVKKTLKIGKLRIDINDFTNKLESNTINEVKINIQSFWNNQINNVYATLIVDDKNIQTPSITLKPWQKTSLTGYINTNGLKTGEHTANVKLYANDNLISSKEGKVTISQKKEIVKKETKNNSSLNMILTITIIAVIIIGLNIFWILKKRRKKDE